MSLLSPSCLLLLSCLLSLSHFPNEMNFIRTAEHTNSATPILRSLRRLKLTSSLTTSTSPLELHDFTSSTSTSTSSLTSSHPLLYLCLRVLVLRLGVTGCTVQYGLHSTFEGTHITPPHSLCVRFFTRFVIGWDPCWCYYCYYVPPLIHTSYTYIHTKILPISPPFLQVVSGQLSAKTFTSATDTHSKISPRTTYIYIYIYIYPSKGRKEKKK